MATPQQEKKLHSIDAERGILGCLLLAGANSDADYLDSILDEVKITDFYFEAHRYIFSAALVIYKRGAEVDFVTVVEVLERENLMESIGGIDYITKLFELVPSPAMYRQYVSIVKDYAALREYERAGREIYELARSGSTSFTVQGEAEKLIQEITERGIKKESVPISEIAETEYQRIEKAMRGEYDEFGLPTGFSVLDRTLWGLQKSDMIVLAARPGTGKTAFALDVLNEVAIKNKKKAIFFSLEMPSVQIIKRLYSIVGKIDNYAIKSGKGLEGKKDELLAIKEKIKNSGLTIEDASNITVPEMFNIAKRKARKEGLDLIVIDYLQIAKPSRTLGNRALEVGEMARDVKNMARRLNVPVIVLSQLNRESDKNGGELPVLADLRESGEIENNADIVIFLHQSTKVINEEVKPVDLIIRKFRNGQMKKIGYKFRGNIFTFEEMDAPPTVKQRKLPVSDLKEVDDEEDLPF